MSDTPTYDQLSALCAQLAAALRKWGPYHGYVPEGVYSDTNKALTAYAASSPDPGWQRVPKGHVVVPAQCTNEMLNGFHLQHGKLLNGSDMETRMAINAAISAGKRARGEG